MGQRLVVTVESNGKYIAKLYYHWSAYSISALTETRDILNCLLDEENPIDDLRLRLIRFAENNGGCIDGGKNSSEFRAIQEMYPNETFKEDGSRNNGLIALTSDGMEEFESWSEGSVVIDLDDGTIFNSVFDMETIDEYNEWYGESATLEDFNKLDVDIEEIAFEDLDMVIDKLKELPGYAFENGGRIFVLYA